MNEIANKFLLAGERFMVEMTNKERKEKLQKQVI